MEGYQRDHMARGNVWETWPSFQAAAGPFQIKPVEF